MNLIIKFNKKLTLNNRIKRKKTNLVFGNVVYHVSKNFKFFLFKINFLYILNHFNILILKIIFLIIFLVIILSVDPYEPRTKK
jgi:hypothetical protein